MTFIKNVIYLIIFIVIAFFALRFSLYGLMVNVTGTDLKEVKLKDIELNSLKKKRYLKITNFKTIKDPLVFLDQSNEPVSYIYPLLLENQDPLMTKSIILVESDTKIYDGNYMDLVGLLKPYWYTIDEEIITAFERKGVLVEEQGYYLQIGEKPLKWYWYLLVVFIAVLFLFRLLEAATKTVMNKNDI